MLFYFVCGGPCQFSSFKQSSGTLFSPEYSLFVHFLSFYYYLINIVNITILSLNFFSKMTQCPFNYSNAGTDNADNNVHYASLAALNRHHYFLLFNPSVHNL